MASRMKTGKKRKRRHYADDFKEQAVQLLVDGHSTASVATRLGLPGTNLLYKWKREMLGRGGVASHFGRPLSSRRLNLFFRLGIASTCCLR